MVTLNVNCFSIHCRGPLIEMYPLKTHKLWKIINPNLRVTLNVSFFNYMGDLNDNYGHGTKKKRGGRKEYSNFLFIIYFLAFQPELV